MNRIQNFRKRIASFILPKEDNSTVLARDFFKYGNRKSMTPDWTQVVMDDRDLYTGYFYAAITRRANKVAKIAKENIRTVAAQENFVHPYITIMDNSSTFTDTEFWRNISTFLDLEGVFYLMAVRAQDGERGTVSNIKEFKLLNPYNVRRVLNQETMEVSGYIETRGGLVREIPNYMIIEIRELNPFDQNVPFAMTDAAKDAQFTLKTAGDYTRHALKNNINAPGILTTDVTLPPQEFQNFQDRVNNHTKGEPIFGNGSGAVEWQGMQMELSKAALENVNEMNREALLSVSGMSKTGMNIEQSGVTRETAKVQKDLMVEDHVLPRIQLIIDALNQDYRNNYEDSRINKAMIVIDNPVKSDHESDIKETELKQGQFDLFTQMIAKGYDVETASQFVCGELDLEMIGEPVNEPIAETPQIPANTQPDASQNAFDAQGNQGLIKQQEGALKNAIVNTDGQLVAAAMNRVNRIVKNQVGEDEIITKTEKKKVLDELALILAGFYGIILNFRGKEIMRDRSGLFALPGAFKIDRVTNATIKKLAKKVAASHVDTVLSDILQAAREGATKGLSVPEVQQLIKQKFSDVITETRAKAIARTETNRAFTQAQYEADRQFIEINGLQQQAYKIWHTRSANPCAYCESLAAEGEVPFYDNFRDLGDAVNVVVDGKHQSLDVNFEALYAGNAHTNCSCDYTLVIRDSNNALKTEIANVKKMANDAKKTIEEAQTIHQHALEQKKIVEQEKDQFEQQVKEIDKILEDL
jgi:hypothetical protein